MREHLLGRGDSRDGGFTQGREELYFIGAVGVHAVARLEARLGKVEQVERDRLAGAAGDGGFKPLGRNIAVELGAVGCGPAFDEVIRAVERGGVIEQAHPERRTGA